MGCLLVIFLVTLAFNLLVVGRTSIIDLMSAGRKNEAIKTRNPMLSAVVFVLGAVLIGVAYYRLLRDGLPVDAPANEMDAAMAQFSLTTGIVVAGTILFFFGLSGFLLRVLQSAKGLYWRGLNMFTLRQLSAKVNTVSFSMAMISMILFLAITSVTGGMSIANVMNTSVERNNPADYSRIVIYYGERTLENSYDSDRPMGIAEEPFDIVELSKGDRVNPALPTRRRSTSMVSSVSECRWKATIPRLAGEASPLSRSTSCARRSTCRCRSVPGARIQMSWAYRS
ncbi:MAG: hypothetical protein ACLTSX_05775 [Collinsella sp.]